MQYADLEIIVVSPIIPFMSIRAVIDTNVLLSGMKSNQGASFAILRLMAEDAFELSVSVPLILEYEAVLKKHLDRRIFTDQDIGDFLNFLCKVGIGTEIYYLWRPILSDPYDDHILEMAVASGSSFIVTFNTRDFVEAQKFGIDAITPREFLGRMGENRWVH